MSDPNGTGKLRVVGLGEALFDQIGDQLLLGGAPLNVAVHAHQLLAGVGGEGIVASRVGQDPLGQRIRDQLRDRQMTVDYLQIDAQRPTGVVQVDAGPEGQPTYTITTGVAWDDLEMTPAWHSLARHCSAVCFGTLAQRSATSRNAIREFLHAAEQAVKVLDLNLRQHYFDAEVLQASLSMADVLKLNEEELEVVNRTCFPRRPVGSIGASTVNHLLEAYPLRMVALTRGARGTLLTTAAGEMEAEVPQVRRSPAADSVGAGDASCAAMICGLLLGWPDDQTLRLANRAGAVVAGLPGATPPLPEALLETVGTRR